MIGRHVDDEIYSVISLTSSKLDEQDMWDTTREVRMDS